MKHCPTCDCDAAPVGIRAYAANSHPVGGCNFCDRHIDSHGMKPHDVLVLSGGGLQARVCRDCARTLLPMLRGFAGMSIRKER
jgi:hypothetical protein